MPQDPKKRQKALQRKAAKRKEKRASGLARPGGHGLLRLAGDWPLEEVLLTRDWQKEGEIIQILVARRSSLGQIAVGAFLVDLGCLGVKNAFARVFNSRSEYVEGWRSTLVSRQPMMRADLNLVAKIIREGIAYAHSLGFRANPDYRDAMLVLGNADPDASAARVRLGGKDGKPFFVAGPYDNVPKTLAQLTKAVGPDGFHFIAPVRPDMELFTDDEGWDEA